MCAPCQTGMLVGIEYSKFSKMIRTMVPKLQIIALSVSVHFRYCNELSINISIYDHKHFY